MTPEGRPCYCMSIVLDNKKPSRDNLVLFQRLNYGYRECLALVVVTCFHPLDSLIYFSSSPFLRSLISRPQRKARKQARLDAAPYPQTAATPRSRQGDAKVLPRCRRGDAKVRLIAPPGFQYSHQTRNVD